MMLAACIAAVLLTVICFGSALVGYGFGLIKTGIGAVLLALGSGYCFHVWKGKENTPQLGEKDEVKTDLQNKEVQPPVIQKTAKHLDMYAGSYKPNPEWTLKPVSPKSREEAIILAQQMLNQGQETAKILNRTTDPSVFFHRYDFLIGRCSCLVDCMDYVEFSETPPDELLQRFCDQEQRNAAVSFMTRRCYEKAQQRIKSLKTEKGKMNAAERFESEILAFADYMSAENIADVQNKRKELELKIQQKEI